jgi:hypothetical protein
MALTACSLAIGCASSQRTMVIVPRPHEPGLTHVAPLSLVMAKSIRTEIEQRGYAVLVPDATGRPDRCVVGTTPSGETELTLYAWVQQIDVSKHEFGDARSFGGIVVVNAHGERLARAVGLTSEPGRPSNDLYEVGKADDPRVIAAAERFGPWMLGSVRKFAKKVRPYLN